MHDDQFVRFYQFLLNTSIIARWTLFIVPVLAIVWIPGIIGLTASRRGEVRSRLHPGFMAMWINLFSIFVDMGSAFDMVEHMAKRRMGRCAIISYDSCPMSLKFYRLVGLSCRSVCLIQYSEAVETVSQRDFYPLTG